MIALYITALVAELVGLGLAADGLRRTWREFRNPTDAFWAPLTAPSATLLRWAYLRVRRLVGKSVPPRTVELNDTAAATESFTRDFEARWDVLPPDDDTQAWLKLLYRRSREINERMQRVEGHIATKAAEDERRYAETTAAIDEVRTHATRQIRTITIGGLREQALGWLLIVVGTVLGGLGNILAAL